MYSYFISFYMTFTGGYQYGNINYKLNKPITTYDDVLSISDDIKAQYKAETVVIITYDLLGGANVQASPFQIVHPSSDSVD